MANENHRSNARDQSRSGGRGNINRHPKKHRSSFIQLPPVPPAQSNLLQSAPAQQQAIALPVVMDPEAMPAKRGLNEWGAFTGGGNMASKSGISGLGPLLFRHGRAKDDAENTTSKEASSSSSPLTGRDLVEMDRLQRNDPVSFNPMRAISWAKLDNDDDDDDVVENEESSSAQGEKGKRTENAEILRNDGDVPIQQQRITDATTTGQPRHQGLAFDKAMITHRGGQLYTSTPMTVQKRFSQNTKSPAVPKHHVDTKFSNGVVAVPDMGHRVSVQPAAVSFSNPTQRIHSMQPQHHQQRKHHQMHERQTDPSPSGPCVRQESDCPPSDSFPAQPYHAQHHIQHAYTTYSTKAPPSYQIFHTPSLLPPPQQGNTGPLHCLASPCQAQFASEVHLNAHYQAFHAPNQFVHSGSQQAYSPPDSLSCSWNLCGAGGFTSNNALMCHVKAEHLLQCPVPGCCDRVFASKKQVEAHVRNRLSCQ